MAKQLLISIDPGFDSVKVIANGHHFKFPFSAIETDERLMSDYGDQREFILYKDRSGATWRVGQFARGLLFGAKAHTREDPFDGFYTEERFISAEFTVGLRSAIAKAINIAGFFSDLKDLEISVIVALPHAIRTKYASTVSGLIAGEHNYYMTFGKGREKPYHFTVKESHVFTVSQTIAAILGETSDDAGYINEEKFFYLSNGPTLVIDGGYYTVGLVPVSRGGSVDDSQSESDTRHAMKNVNMAVAMEISEKRPDVKHYNVEYLLSQGEPLLRSFNQTSGLVETIDLAAIRQEKAHEVCHDLIQHLNEKFDNLLDFKYILVTGGTGACFFDQLKKFYIKTGLVDDDHILLTSPIISGTTLPIEYAISVGAYKGLCGKSG